MNAEFEKYHLIDRYLRNELSSEEQAAFEKQMLVDSGFAEDVEYQKSVNEVISAASFHQLRQQMSRDIAAREAKIRVRKWYGGLLVLLISGLVAGYFVMNLNQRTSGSSVATNQKEAKISSEPEEKQVSKILPAPVEKDSDQSPASVNQTKAASPLSSVERKPLETEEATNPPDTAMVNLSPKPEEKKTSVQKTSNPGTEVKDSTPALTDKEVRDKVPDIKVSTPTEDICEGVRITSEWKVESACPNENNGLIQLDESSVTGGTAPYMHEFYKGNVKISDKQLSALYSGTYTLKITDAKGCTESGEIYVGEEPCREKEVSISPSHGETWEFDGDEGESYYLSILNQSGQMVYKSFLTGRTNWDGTGNLGIPVETGLYIYIVEYSNGKKLKGQITVIK